MSRKDWVCVAVFVLYYEQFCFREVRLVGKLTKPT